MRVLLKHYFTDELHTLFLEQLHYPIGRHLPSAGMPATAHWGAPHHSPTPAFQPIVPLYPSTADYCELLASLAAQPESHDSSLEQALRVLLHWSGLIARGFMPYPDLELLKTALYSRALLPTVWGNWVSVSDGLYVMDDQELAQACKDKPVHFLWLPESMQPICKQVLLCCPPLLLHCTLCSPRARVVFAVAYRQQPACRGVNSMQEVALGLVAQLPAWAQQ